MKRLLLVIIFLFIITSFSNYDINNKRYLNNKIEINYPVFNNGLVNKFINVYITNKLNKEYIFIDYDYYKVDNIINLNFYNFKRKDQLVNYTVEAFKIDLKVSKIEKINNYIMNNYNYLEQSIIDKSKPMIAFTFDDGPNYNTSKLIDVLNKYNVKATFFILGNRAINNKHLLLKLSKNNMEIGNHTYNHKLLTRYNKKIVKQEIEKTNNLIKGVTGKVPTLLRPSYGSTNRKIRELASAPIILWNMDTLDWKYHNSNRIENKILNNVKDGSIILMHDIYSASVNAVDKVIPKLLEKNYQIVTISEMAYYKNVKLEKNKVYRFIK